MTGGGRGTVAIAATAAATVVAVGTAVVLLAGGDSADPPRPTTPPPSTTTTGPAEFSLVRLDAPDGVLFTHAGVAVRVEDLRDPAPGAGDFTAEPAGDFVAAQRAAGGSVELLRRQIGEIASLLGPALAREPAADPMAVVARPEPRDGGLNVAVMVFNTADVRRAVDHVDLQVLDADGEAATRRVRFLAGASLGIGPRTAWFGVVAFQPDEVSSPTADFTSYSWTGDVAFSS